MIANAGAGPFEVFGSRPSTSRREMSIEQRVYQTTGGYRSVPTPAVMYYAGDGHVHWHVRNLEGAKLTDLQGNLVSDAYTKIGFCPSDNAIYDSSVPGTPTTAAYTGCGTNQPNLLSILVGISVGWGDWYPANVVYQWIDITGLPNATYRIWAFAESQSAGFPQANESNNATWTDIRIGKNVRIVAYGPHI